MCSRGTAANRAGVGALLLLFVGVKQGVRIRIVAQLSGGGHICHADIVVVIAGAIVAGLAAPPLGLRALQDGLRALVALLPLILLARLGRCLCAPLPPIFRQELYERVKQHVGSVFFGVRKIGPPITIGDRSGKASITSLCAQKIASGSTRRTSAMTFTNS